MIAAMDAATIALEKGIVNSRGCVKGLWGKRSHLAPSSIPCVLAMQQDALAKVKIVCLIWESTERYLVLHQKPGVFPEGGAITEKGVA